ncbi:hypothetical protein A4U53_027825 [Rhizobium ruizarguesonis]|uniref:Uncharacterized protein n=1 Tax=Rhizobium ruizarguesonis TaxID=2081791 RepID=A0ACD5EL97_9HYPH
MAADHVLPSSQRALGTRFGEAGALPGYLSDRNCRLVLVGGAPSLIVFPIVLLLENLGKLGELMLALLAIPGLVVLGFALPWFSGWCDIAVGLMFGRFTAASAKEKALAESIHAYRTRAI